MSFLGYEELDDSLDYFLANSTVSGVVSVQAELYKSFFGGSFGAYRASVFGAGFEVFEISEAARKGATEDVLVELAGAAGSIGGGYAGGYMSGATAAALVATVGLTGGTAAIAIGGAVVLGLR